VRPPLNGRNLFASRGTSRRPNVRYSYSLRANHLGVNPAIVGKFHHAQRSAVHGTGRPFRALPARPPPTFSCHSADPNTPPGLSCASPRAEAGRYAGGRARAGGSRPASASRPSIQFMTKRERRRGSPAQPRSVDLTPALAYPPRPVVFVPGVACANSRHLRLARPPVDSARSRSASHWRRSAGGACPSIAHQSLVCSPARRNSRIRLGPGRSRPASLAPRNNSPLHRPDGFQAVIPPLDWARGFTIGIACVRPSSSAVYPPAVHPSNPDLASMLKETSDAPAPAAAAPRALRSGPSPEMRSRWVLLSAHAAHRTFVGLQFQPRLRLRQQLPDAESLRAARITLPRPRSINVRHASGQAHRNPSGVEGRRHHSDAARRCCGDRPFTLQAAHARPVQRR